MLFGVQKARKSWQNLSRYSVKEWAREYLVNNKIKECTSAKSFLEDALIKHSIYESLFKLVFQVTYSKHTKTDTDIV